MLHAIAVLLLLCVVQSFLPAVGAQSVRIAGYISDGTDGWFLTEDVCHSMRPTRIYSLDPSQAALWMQYQGSMGMSNVVILTGELIKTGQATYFHADSVTTMNREAFCLADPMGVPEFSDPTGMIVVAAVALAILALRRKR